MMKELSMHVLDIANNSVRAKATEITITIIEDLKNDRFELTISDNGAGIPDHILKTIRDPFTTSRTMRKVGLGIPFLQETCTQCGGDLEISTEIGRGTTIHAWMTYRNIDRPPLGDITATMVTLFTSNDAINLKYIHQYNGEVFDLSTSELKEVLGDVPLSDMNVYLWLKNFIEENLNEIKNVTL